MLILPDRIIKLQVVTALLLLALIGSGNGEAMTQRVNIGLEPDTNQRTVGEALRASGTEILRTRLDPGNVLVIDIPAEADMESFLAKARTLPGVRYAEPDSFQSSF